MQIAFTGPRKLTAEEEQSVYQYLGQFIATQNADWYVGDAPGLDAFIVRAAGYYQKTLTVCERQGNQRWQFAARSKQTIDSISKLSEPWLYAFPNKLCPPGCQPCSNPKAQGSGTWLTIAYAKYRGVQISLFPLGKYRYGDRSWLPDWLKEEASPKQLSLLDV
jgi:hypothetical protein